jgi:hypothetical protein
MDHLPSLVHLLIVALPCQTPSRRVPLTSERFAFVLRTTPWVKGDAKLTEMKEMLAFLSVARTRKVTFVE